MSKKTCIIFTILIVVALLLLVLMCGCGNMSCSMGNYTFNHVHLVHSNECFDVLQWWDNNNGIEILTPQGSMFFSEGTYILTYGETCPICNALGG